MRISQPSPWRQEKREASATLVGRSESWRFSGTEGPPWNEGPPVSHCAPAQCQVQSGTGPGVSLHLTLRCILASNELWNPPRKVILFNIWIMYWTGNVKEKIHPKMLQRCGLYLDIASKQIQLHLQEIFEDHIWFQWVSRDGHERQMLD